MLRTLAKRLLSPVLVVLGLLGCDDDKPKADNPLTKKLIAGQVEAGDHAYPLPYRLYIPEGYDEKKKYPLVLFLHGANGWGNDNQTQLDENVAQLISPLLQGIEPTFVLAPQCPHGDQWIDAAKKIPFQNYEQDKVPESDASKMTFELLSELPERYSIDPDRVYITGPSMGGSGTWDFITRHPGIFAAAVPVTGVSPPGRASVIKDLPIWAFHGAEDGASPVTNTREMVKALKAAGNTQVRFSDLKGVGHNSWGPAYSNKDMYRWLLSQKRGASPATDASATEAPSPAEPE